MYSDQDILNALRAMPRPMSLRELETLLPQVPRRTLQRRLKRLAEEGLLVREGERRWLRYSLTAAPMPTHRDHSAEPIAPEPDSATSAPRPTTRAVQRDERPAPNPGQPRPATTSESTPPFHGIPLAPDALEVLKLVSRPVSERAPVGYQWDWVQSYTPGHSWFLSDADRRRLNQMGTTEAAGMPAGTHARAIMERLLIDLSWASSHLEGNTYSRLDTKELITRGEVASGHDLIETQMILNHKRAIEAILGDNEPLELSVFGVRGLHGTLAENLLSDPADEGRIRQRSVLISGSVYRPLDVPDMIEQYLREIIEKANLIPDAFERSFFLLVQLPYLQPFADVNKRTARLVANVPLIQNNLCPLTFVDVPVREYALAVLGVYELARTELMRDLYLWAYERSTREYVAVQRSVMAPNPLRLRYRDAIRHLVRTIVQNPALDPLMVIDEGVTGLASSNESDELSALVIAELRGLHEGTISRYGLRLSEFNEWRTRQGP